MRQDERLATHEGPLVEPHEAVEAQLERRVAMELSQGFSAALEVHLNQKQTGFEPCHVQRQHAGGANAECLPAFHQRIPDGDCAIPRYPDLVTEIARVPRSGNVHLHSGDRSAGHPEVVQPVDVGIRHGVQQCAGGRTLKRKRGDALGNVFYRDVQTGGILKEPPQIRIGGRPPKRFLAQSRHRAIVDDFAPLVTPGRIPDLSDAQLVRVAGDQAIDERHRIPSGNQILEQRRNIDQRGGVTDGTVFVLVMGLVATDRVKA